MLKFARLFGAVVVLTGSLAAHAQEAPVPKPYDGHSLVRVQTGSMADVMALTQIGTVLECRPKAGQTHAVLSPEAMAALTDLGLESVTLVENYQTIVDAQLAENDRALAQRGGFFTAYQTNAQINAFTQSLATNNPAFVTRSVIGQSFEGRDIVNMLVTAPYEPGEPRRPQVVLNGCQHAREWISPATVLYILNELVTGAGNDPAIDGMLGSLEFHIIPVVNPDGYAYTFTNQRLWRKNRRPVSGTVGVDLNRNWAFQWGGAGSSGSATSETYRGPSPFSEPESTVLSTYLLTLPDVHAHIDFHNFDQSILGPWAYSTSITPPRVDEHVTIQNAMASAMSAAGVPYVAGLGTDAILGPAAGAMPDWTLGQLNALSWTIELRPNSSFPGFELPPDQIIATGIESFAAIEVLAQFASRTLLIQPTSPIPSEVSSEMPTTLAVSVEEFNLEQIAPGGVALLYRLDGSGAFTEVGLSQNGTAFSGDLPAVACNQSVEFFFRATSTGGTVVTLPEDAPSDVFTAIGTPLSVVFSDTFQTDTGWSISGSVTDGAWERGTPIGGGDRGDPAVDADGSGACYLTDNEDGNSDVDGGSTILTSPVFDLSDGGTISYAYWVGTSTNFAGDQLTVEVATNAAGTNWAELRSYTTPMTAWQNDEIDVASESSPSSTVRIRFIASDLGDPSVIEAGVDAISIVQTGECCPGDCDTSGAVDFGDLVSMLFEFGSPNPDASCDPNASGDVDFADLVQALFLFGPCL